MALINCPECNAQISDAAQACPHCGAPVQKPSVANPQSTIKTNSNECPESHLAKAIIITILCCWPLGIPAIVYAAGVNNAFLNGCYNLALERSRKADKWCTYSLIAGIALWVIYIIFIIIAGVSM